MRLINGNCLEELPKLINESINVDLVLTDLPYGITNCKWDEVIPFDEMWKLVHNITSERTPIIFFGNEPFSSRLRLSNIKEYKYDIIWDKIVRTGFLNANRQPLRQYENIIVFYRKQCYYNPIKWEGEEPSHPHAIVRKKTHNVYNPCNDMPYVPTKWKYPTNIYKLNAAENECQNAKRVHPTQKPVALLEYLIKTFSKGGDLVLDFTMGSGTTGVACKNLNRDFIGIELNEDYFNIAVERINNAGVQQKLI